MKDIGTVEPAPGIGFVYDLKWRGKSWRDDDNDKGEYQIEKRKVLAKTVRTIVFEVFNDWRKRYEKRRVIQAPETYCWTLDEAFEKERLSLIKDIEYSRNRAQELQERHDRLLEFRAVNQSDDSKAGAA